MFVVQPTSRADFDGDGKADFCRLTGAANNQNSTAQCTLSTGTSFGPTITSSLLDWGLDAGRGWVDFNGDGKADFCRLTGAVNNQSSTAQCTVSSGNSFGATTTSGLLDWGLDAGRGWVDFNGDGKADFCRLTGATNNQNSTAQCTLSTGSSFGPTITSSVIDWGRDLGRSWADFNGDSKADFCRLTGATNNQNSTAQCTLSTGSSFGPTITSSVIDWGRDLGRSWADFNGDGKADFCRLTGAANNQNSTAQCTLSTGTSFGPTITSSLLDWGLDAGRGWVDFNGDGKADFCRLTGAVNNQSSTAQCTVSSGNSFGATTTSGLLDWGLDAGRGWVDFNGDGKADFCRLTGATNNQNSTAQCTLSTGSSFGPTSTSTLLDWGLEAGRAWTGIGSLRVAVCPAGNLGSPPSCELASSSCPGGMGTPPNCEPPTPSCPGGQTGSPPKCVTASGPPTQPTTRSPATTFVYKARRTKVVNVKLVKGCSKRYLKVSAEGVSVTAVKRLARGRCRITLRIESSASGTRTLSVKMPHRSRRMIKTIRVS